MAEHRTIYEKYYSRKIGKSEEVHHIDLNHENNDVHNMVVLPREVHQEYHTCLQLLRCNNINSPLFIALKNSKSLRLQIDLLKRYVNVLDKCLGYVGHKNALDNILEERDGRK